MAYTHSPIGQVNSAGDAKALFLKKFSGEVLTAFLRKNCMMTRHLVRSIDNGKSAQFPATWRSTAAYVSPGAAVVPTELLAFERTISVDHPLVAAHYINEWEELVNHYDVRSIYSTMMAEALSTSFDTTALVVLGLAARGTDLLSNAAPDGYQITNANAGTVGETLASEAFNIAQRFDENDVPDDDRYLFLLPAQYYLLAQTTKVINRDWDGAGSFSKGKVLEIAGLEIVKTNNIPVTNIGSTPSGAQNTYHADFSTTVCLAGHKTAIGTVKMMDIASEAKWMIENQATLMVSKMIVGSGILRIEGAAEIITS